MLTGSQRKHLRGLAHGFRPLVQVGKGGVTATVAAALDAALDAHELVKIQIQADRDERRAAAEDLELRLGCECVGMIGRMAILYRRHPDPEHRKVLLP